MSLRVRAALGLVVSLLLAVGALVATPATAQAASLDTAGSLVFIRDYNVWVSAPDGTRARRLTSTGTASKPFSYPSEDDHGHILAIHGNGFVVLDQARHVLHSYAQPLAATGVVTFASLSPDGTRAAYTMTIARNVCDLYGCSMEYLHSLYYLDIATGHLIRGQSVSEAPTASWVTNKRTVMDDGNARVRYQDQGAGAPKLWFQDCDDVNHKCSAVPDSTYWHLFPGVNRRGDRYASVIVDLKYGGPDARTTFLNVFDTANFATGTPPAQPSHQCVLQGADTTQGNGFPSPSMATIQTPSWSPNGRSLAAAFQSADGSWGIYSVALGSDLSTCPTYADFVPVLADASQPRWGRAPLALFTKTALTVSPLTTGYGNAVTLAVKVTGVTSQGSVRFYDGSRLLGTVAVSSGRASLRTTGLAVGQHRLTARYVGTSTRLPSRSSAVTETITKHSTTTALAVSTHTIRKGRTLTLAARVSPARATGWVRFYNGSTKIGSAPLSSGVATFRTSTLGLGGHQLRAVYLGTSRYYTSRSAWVGVTVTR